MPSVALRHDLQRQAVLARQPDPHQTEAERRKHRFDDQRHPRIDAALANDARLVERAGLGGQITGLQTAGK